MAEIDDKTEASISQGQGYGFSSLAKVAKAMQRGNRQNDAENGRIRKSFRKKVGSMVSTVFCKPSKFTESGSGSQSHANDEAMTKLKNMVESLHIIVKGSEGKPEGGSGREDGPKLRRTYSKYMRKRVDEWSEVRWRTKVEKGVGRRRR
ncbi:hypothetical protein V6N13_108251 [Hibiscus sabdariffa]|uniref:Uncharacterized protein n=1 Tax=Hibiscus sabdariffa TaxID=183260 RepID=A0ABR2SRM5_9ROSI